MLVPIEVTVDEWTTDTDDNRRIRAAAHRLLRLPRLPDTVRVGLGRIDRLLAEVQLPRPGEPVPAWTPNRLNVRLHQLLRMTDIVLSNQAFEHGLGIHESRGFVIRMEQLFETLVTRLLQEQDDDVRLHPQATYKLDTRKRLTIKPDLVFIRGGRAVAVADTKYKILDDNGKIRNEDGYQLVTYCKRLSLEVGHLIYAAGHLPDEPFDIPWAGVRLDVHKIDLTATIDDIERQVIELRARLIAAHGSRTGSERESIAI
jgi:5-methylcytosine-specific restriction enzyme subunit McrC